MDSSTVWRIRRQYNRLHTQSLELNGKRLELLKEVVPQIPASAAAQPTGRGCFPEYETAAHALIQISLDCSRWRQAGSA